MLLLTLVVVAAALTLRPLVDPLVERVRVPRPVSIAAASLAVIALVVGLVGGRPRGALARAEGPAGARSLRWRAAGS